MKIAKQQEVEVSADVERRADVSSCIDQGLITLKEKYTNYLALQKTAEAKSALTDHYVAAVQAIKGTVPILGESENSYRTRQQENDRKVKEKWAKFEMAK